MPVPAYDGPSAAASVIMSPALRACPVLFVEGVCEVLLISHHLPDHETQVIACGGHSGVKQAIEVIEKWELESDMSLAVLGFIDKDYGTRGGRRRITTSSNRDVEIDMYLTEAGERLLKEKASRGKCPDARATLCEAMQQLHTVGLVRQYSSQNGYSWDVNGIKIEKCLASDGSLALDKFLTLLQQRNSITEAEMLPLKTILQSGLSIRTQLVIRGHDVSIMLGKWLRKKIGNRRKAETRWGVIEENLRLATKYSELRRYNWARRIRGHLTTPCT